MMDKSGCPCNARSKAGTCPCVELGKNQAKNEQKRIASAINKLVKNAKQGKTIYCPLEVPKCEKFPEGRCGMEDLGLCDCKYPVPPCMAPPRCADALPAPPQYCLRKNCCMGLSIPYCKEKARFEVGEKPSYYRYVPTKPGREESRYIIEILDEPPTKYPFGEPQERKNPDWKIIKYGDGYLQCKRAAERNKYRNPRQSNGTQFNVRDNPMDEETRIVMEYREHQRRLAEADKRARMM